MTTPSLSRVLCIGLDGMEPRIAEPMCARGELPHLASLQYSRLSTTTPAQTPVAWSTFATGTDPGEHGIFDFVRRDPRRYLPDLALNAYESKSALLPPKAVNRRWGKPLWDLLAAAGVPATVLRCPCTYPPDEPRGRLLAGVGVPDLRGGLGTSTWYTSDPETVQGDSERVVVVEDGAQIRTHFIGPWMPSGESTLDFEIDGMQLRCGKQSITLEPGVWSDWLSIGFKMNLLQTARGKVRFYLRRREPLELLASPINFDAHKPMFPISHPPGYAGELADAIGTYYTAGMVEEHGPLSNGRIDKQAFLAQCAIAMREREEMLFHELCRFDEGLLFCLFDTPDRLAHMMWRDDRAQIEAHYRECDAVIGRAMDAVDDRTLMVVLSDHGMTSFDRGLHLNGWLRDQGLLGLKGDATTSADFFDDVDWSRTKAYALGLGGIYLNIAGRERYGTVRPEEIEPLTAGIAKSLSGLVDEERGAVAVRSVRTRAELYQGSMAEESPDLTVNFDHGYRVSWATALGGTGEGLFEDNTRAWSGDHTVDPELVPGVLWINRPIAEGAHIRDLAPTILRALGVKRGRKMEGKDLLS